MCYFVNDGGAIHNFKINTIDGIHLSIEPKDNLQRKESGYLKFELGSNVGNLLYFDLSYYDEINKFHKEKYFYSILENKFSVVEIEKTTLLK